MFPLRRVDQIGIVVRNLDRTMKRYWEELGVGPWRAYTYKRPLVKEMTYKGRFEDYSMRLALAEVGPIVFELIEPLTQNNIYAEHLDKKGEGLHHVGIVVPSVDMAVAQAGRLGYRLIQSGRGYGRCGDGAYAYLETEGSLGTTFEVMEKPQERCPPDFEFPSI